MPWHVFVKRGSATTSQTQNFYWQIMTSTDLTGQLVKVLLTIVLVAVKKNPIRPFEQPPIFQKTLLSAKSRWNTNSSSFVFSTIYPRALSNGTTSMTLKGIWLLYPINGRLYLVRRPQYSVYKFAYFVEHKLKRKSKHCFIGFQNISLRNKVFNLIQQHMDVAFWRNTALSAEVDENFTEAYDWSDHIAIKLSLFYWGIQFSSSNF